ncbi:MinD-like ATPase involved in chromosome partitioning or flagellar assembly/tetratricopeptide (TPR) repeat protein [Streptacidiphilus sp. MAP12-16]|uniref:FxSxx-COOH system tetratricopeptide repeat protein n=1 Tax=Streptacidiphilus sp. MAP12-16 TaxID=3156300 RepID=UPI003519B2D7
MTEFQKTAERAREGRSPAEDRAGQIITFYSYKGGTGRTMALANTAWILASNGFRVLTVDWDLEAPGLARFFHPFLDPAVPGSTTGVIDLILEYREEAMRDLARSPDWHREFARVRPHAVSLSWPLFPDGGSLDFLSAGLTNSDYATTVASINWDRFYEKLNGGRFFEAMREDMRRHYDYVLIDSRTGLSDIAEICTVEMPDTLVVCFTLSGQSIEGASAIAQHIAKAYGNRKIRILPVPMRIDEGEKEKADAGRALARARFNGLPVGLEGSQLIQYWGSVEIPYKPFYAYEEILATFGDPSGGATSMLSACERLTSVITAGRVASLPAIPEDVRRRYVDSFTRRPPAGPADLFLSYAPEDRMWADWIESVLTRAGIRVVPREVGADPRVEAERGADAAARTLAVLSPAYVRSPQAQAVWEAVAGADPSGSRRELIPVRVGDVRLTTPFSNRNAVDLVRLEEEQAAAALLRALGRADTVLEPSPSDGPRFPATRPEIWNPRLRNPAFTGRSAVLERLRDQLRGSSTATGVQPTPQALSGLGGVGKTQIALEYAHRFMADYDLVWWIEAEQPDQVVLSLAELAGRLKLQVGDSVAEAAEAAREALRQGTRYARWLLIFDNADEPASIARFFPAGPGHVLVTSRNQVWSGQAEDLEVDVFTRGESIEHLCRRVQGLSRKDADRVAEAVGDLPLAVEIAAAWLETTGTPVSTYVAELQQEAPLALAATQVNDYPSVFGATWNVSINRLREQSPAAARLLQLCAFFSADPISMSLFYSGQMIRTLVEYDPDLQDKFMLGKVIQAIGRYGLAKVDAGSNTFQVHRMVQAVIRSQLDAEEQVAAMHEVHRILVDARPLVDDMDDPDNWPPFERIWPHLVPSKADDCDEADTRQLLIDRVRYLWKRGELEAGAELGRRLHEAWITKLGELDRQTLLLRFQLANVLRTQGRFEEALAYDEDTLERQKVVLTPDHPYTLMTAGSLGADLRALGRFQKALELDKETYNKFKDLFGEDHPRTMAIAHNLAIDYRFTGRYASARDLDQETLERRIAVLGPRHPYTLTTKAALAEDLRSLGDFDGSVELLEEFRVEYTSVPVLDLPTLRYTKSLAVALRKAGRQGEAKRLTKETYERYLERYGANFPDSLACALNLAADYSASGDKETARDSAREVYQGYQDSLGARHPFTLACANNVAIYLRGSDAVPEAVELGERTLTALGEVVGPRHPYTLSAMINLANAHADAGELERSEELLRGAITILTERYGAQHPDVVVAQANLAATLREAGHREKAQELRAQVLAELVRQFGEEHPTTQSCRGWKRINRDLEVQPV